MQQEQLKTSPQGRDSSRGDVRPLQTAPAAVEEEPAGDIHLCLPELQVLLNSSPRKHAEESTLELLRQG